MAPSRRFPSAYIIVWGIWHTHVNCEQYFPYEGSSAQMHSKNIVMVCFALSNLVAPFISRKDYAGVRGWTLLTKGCCNALPQVTTLSNWKSAVKQAAKDIKQFFTHRCCLCPSCICASWSVCSTSPELPKQAATDTFPDTAVRGSTHFWKPIVQMEVSCGFLLYPFFFACSHLFFISVWHQPYYIRPYYNDLI